MGVFVLSGVIGIADHPLRFAFFASVQNSNCVYLRSVATPTAVRASVLQLIGEVQLARRFVSAMMTHPDAT
jgi:hypothetical protein